jgi:hypothetical protein
MMDKRTANRNLRLALILAIFSVLVFAATLVVGIIVSHG